MGSAAKEYIPPDVQAVALKAFGKIAEAWRLTDQEAAKLVDMPEAEWKRATESTRENGREIEPKASWMFNAPASASALSFMVERHQGHAGKARFTKELTEEQMLRFSALVGLYKGLELYFGPPIAKQWVKRSNEGPEFNGKRPIDVMIKEGLPKIRQVKDYVDALRGGA